MLNDTDKGYMYIYQYIHNKTEYHQHVCHPETKVWESAILIQYTLIVILVKFCIIQ